MRRARWTLAALALLSAGGCATMGVGLEDVLGEIGGMGGDVRGEIEWVDTRRQEIEVTSSFRQRARVAYDSRTQVLYRGERYRVSSLEPGDRVSIQVEQSRRGERYARVIRVEETGRDPRDGGSDQVRSGRFDGQVGWVDSDRGRFELRTSRGTYTVSLPYGADRSTVDRFHRLRSGNTVRIQGELLGNGRIELDRFL